MALFNHLDAAVFADAGNVAPHVADVNLDKRSYGAGLRLHSRESTFARVDIAHGGEGWRFMFRLSDPLQLKRPPAARRRCRSFPELETSQCATCSHSRCRR